jgi:hypothetical protein
VLQWSYPGPSDAGHPAVAALPMTRRQTVNAMAVTTCGRDGCCRHWQPGRARRLKMATSCGPSRRVHGTFQDSSGGLGVVSGDMTIARFEVLNGSVTAIGRISGAMADSSGTVLGPVEQEPRFRSPTSPPPAISCGWIRRDRRSHSADSRRPLRRGSRRFRLAEGAAPKARPVVRRRCCSRRAADGGRNALSLNDVVVALAIRPAR